jgi:hypothetical protein
MAFLAWILAALTFFDSFLLFLNQWIDPFPTENHRKPTPAAHLFFGDADDRQPGSLAKEALG